MNSKYFVPLEMAKQLKEKGYPQLDNEWYYNLNGEIKLYQDLDEGYKEECPIMLAHYYFAAPTYHEVIDWLREQYGLIVCVGFSVARCWTWSVGRLREILTLGAYGEKESTREKALNVAILKALEMI